MNSLCPARLASHGRFLVLALMVLLAPGASSLHAQAPELGVGPTHHAHVSGGGFLCLGGTGTIQVDLSLRGISATSATWVLTWSDGLVETVSGPATTTHYRQVPYTSVTTTYTITTVCDFNLFPCTNPATGSATFSPTLFAPLPSAVVGGSTVMCPLGSAQITATLGSGSAPPYQWTIVWSDGVSETVSSPTQPHVHGRTVAPTATTTYTITSVTDDSNSCIFPATIPGTGSATVNLESIPATTVASATLSGSQLTVTGSIWPLGGLPGTIWLHQTPLLTTVVSATELTATVPASMIGSAGGAPVHVVAPSQNAGCWRSVSNAVPVVWNPSRTNRGTVVNLVDAANGTMTFRVEGGDPFVPVSLMADVGFPLGQFLPPVPVLGGQTLSTYSVLSIPLLDGLGALGPWGGGPPAALNGLGYYELTLPTPASASGAPFRLQALFLDAGRPEGVSLTWPLEGFVP